MKSFTRFGAWSSLPEAIWNATALSRHGWRKGRVRRSCSSASDSRYAPEETAARIGLKAWSADSLRQWTSR